MLSGLLEIIVRIAAWAEGGRLLSRCRERRRGKKEEMNGRGRRRSVDAEEEIEEGTLREGGGTGDGERETENGSHARPHILVGDLFSAFTF